jgi:hypothetical protein
MTSSTLASSDVTRLESVLQRLNTQIPLVLAPIGVVLVAFGEVTSTHWAETSGAAVGISGALIGAILAVLTATTTTPNSQIVAKSVTDARTGVSSWVAGSAHPLSNGTPIDPAVGLSALQAAAADIRNGSLTATSSLETTTESPAPVAPTPLAITVTAATPPAMSEPTADNLISSPSDTMGIDELLDTQADSSVSNSAVTGEDIDDFDLTSTDLDGEVPTLATNGDDDPERARELLPSDSSRPRNS